MDYVVCEETVDLMIKEFIENDISISEEIEDVKGTISNEQSWQKGSSTKEEAQMHEENIKILSEYLNRLEEMN